MCCSPGESGAREAIRPRPWPYGKTAWPNCPSAALKLGSAFVKEGPLAFLEILALETGGDRGVDRIHVALLAILESLDHGQLGGLDGQRRIVCDHRRIVAH